MSLRRTAALGRDGFHPPRFLNPQFFFDFHSKVAGLRRFRRPATLCANFNGEIASDFPFGKPDLNAQASRGCEPPEIGAGFLVRVPQLLGGAASSRPGSLTVGLAYEKDFTQKIKKRLLRVSFACSWEGRLPAAQVPFRLAQPNVSLCELRRLTHPVSFRYRIFRGLTPPARLRIPCVCTAAPGRGRLPAAQVPLLLVLAYGKRFYAKKSKNASSCELPHLLLGGAASSRPGS